MGADKGHNAFMKKILLFIWALLFIAGCCPKVSTVITREVKVPVPITEDTVNAIWMDGYNTADTLWTNYFQGIKQDSSSKHDTTILVRYYPKLQKFYIYSKPDSVIVYDTTQVTKPAQIVHDSIWMRLGYVMAGVIVLLIIIFLIKLKII